MGSSPPVWLVPSMWSPWNGFSIRSSWCARLHLGRPSPRTDQQAFSGAALLPGFVPLTPRHGPLLLFCLSRGSRHLDERLGCRSWGCHFSSTKGSSHAAHPCHAGLVQPWHGASVRRIPEGNGTAAGRCHLDGQPASYGEFVQEVPAAAAAAMENGMEIWSALEGCEDCLVGRCRLSFSNGEGPLFFRTFLFQQPWWGAVTFLFHSPCFWDRS